MIKAVIFDFAGVIVGDEFLLWVKSLDKDFEKNQSFYDEIVSKGDAGEISIDEFKQAVASKLHIDPNFMWPALMDKFKLKKETVNLIQTLKKHYRIGLLSNFVPGWIDDLLEKYNLLPYFDKIVVSSTYHVLKPEKEAYEKILELLNTKPSEVMYIDDRTKNVEAAQRFGIKSFHFITIKKLTKDLKEAGINVD